MRDDGGPHRPGRRSAGRPRADGTPVLTPPTGLPIVPDDPRALTDSFADPVARPVVPPAVVRPCVCGHAAEAHEHHRSGRDCGACGAGVCAVYRRRGGILRRVLRTMGLVR